MGYQDFRENNPGMFRNPPDAPVQITNGPGDLWSDPFLTLVQDPVTFTDGRKGTYNRIMPTDMSSGTAMLPVLPDGRVVLADIFRHATREWHWEIPRGFGTPGLSARGNAAKELSEEIGATVSKLHYLGQVNPDSGIHALPVLMYLARIDGIGSLEHSEGIRSARAFLMTEIRNMVRAGALNDSFSLCALYRATLMELI